MSNQSHTTFIQIKIHTAKCDTCNKHNTLTMFRCADCGQQCCTPCWQRKGGDGTHVLNAGDKGWTGQKAQVVSLPRQERKVQRKASENRVVKKRAARRKSRYVVEDEEDEDEDEEEEEDEEVVPKRTRRVTKSQKKPDTANNKLASTAQETPNDYANLPLIQPPKARASPSVHAAADALLLNAVDPTSRDDEGMSLLLRAAAELDKPQSRYQTLPEPRSSALEAVVGYAQDAQRQSPLFVKEELADLEPESVPSSAREQKKYRMSQGDWKAKGRQVQDKTLDVGGKESDERSTMWK